jgi:hypothetical protein
MGHFCIKLAHVPAKRDVCAILRHPVHLRQWRKNQGFGEKYRLAGDKKRRAMPALRHL